MSGPAHPDAPPEAEGLADWRILVLAAGQGRRFGSDKRTARLADGRTLLETSLAPFTPWKGQVEVMLGPADQRLSKRLAQLGWDNRTAPNAGLGMGATLSDAVAGLAPQARGCLIALGDMPWIRSDSIARVLSAAMRFPLVVPRNQGRWGHPRAFSAAYFPRLTQAQDDTGARGLLSEERSRIHFVDVEDSGIVQDVDCRDDLF